MAGELKVINLGFVNAFLVKVKDGFILVDTGVPQQWEALDGQLAAAGCAPGKLKLVIITHGDVDHLGNGVKIKQKYQARIAMHREEADQAEKGMRLKRHIRTLPGKLFYFYRNLVRKMKGIEFVFDTFTPDLFLQDGQGLAEYGWDAKVVHLPGHTKGSIGILTAEGDLIAGDTLVNSHKPDIAVYVDDYEELKKSINKLKQMPVKMVYPGHGKPFKWEELKWND